MNDKEGAVEDSNKESTLITNDGYQIERITKADKIVEFLILVSGQATVFDAHKRQDTMSEFGTKYLAGTLKKSNDLYGMSPSTSATTNSPSLFGGRISDLEDRVH
jgi:hypothetical protein